jgi:hypothetical protein
MANLILNGSTSGSVTLSSPAVSGTTILTLPTSSGTVTVAGVNSNIVSSTAQATTSGTSKDFTSIPSWVKRITVMLSNVSTNGSSHYLIQLGDSGGIENTGYLSASTLFAAGINNTSSTAGFIIYQDTASTARQGSIILSLLDASTNTWVSQSVTNNSNSVQTIISSGSKPLSATLDRVRFTTVNGTDTFDAGSINILYE